MLAWMNIEDDFLGVKNWVFSAAKSKSDQSHCIAKQALLSLYRHKFRQGLPLTALLNSKFTFLSVSSSSMSLAAGKKSRLTFDSI